MRFSKISSYSMLILALSIGVTLPSFGMIEETTETQTTNLKAKPLPETHPDFSALRGFIKSPATPTEFDAKVYGKLNTLFKDAARSPTKEDFDVVWMAQRAGVDVKNRFELPFYKQVAEWMKFTPLENPMTQEHFNAASKTEALFNGAARFPTKEDFDVVWMAQQAGVDVEDRFQLLFYKRVAEWMKFIPLANPMNQKHFKAANKTRALFKGTPGPSTANDFLKVYDALQKGVEIKNRLDLDNYKIQ